MSTGGRGVGPGSQGLGLGWKWRMGRRGHGSGETEDMGGTGGGEWKAKLFIQPAAAEGGRRCSEGERRLAKQGRGREACTLVAGGWRRRPSDCEALPELPEGSAAGGAVESLAQRKRGLRVVEPPLPGDQDGVHDTAEEGAALVRAALQEEGAAEVPEPLEGQDSHRHQLHNHPRQVPPDSGGLQPVLVAAGAVDHPHDAADEDGDGEAAVVEEHVDQEHQVGPVPLVLMYAAGELQGTDPELVHPRRRDLVDEDEDAADVLASDVPLVQVKICIPLDVMQHVFVI